MINKKKIANGIADVQVKLNLFNQKYHCDIKASDFIDKVNNEMRAENYDAWDDAYKSIFSTAYKETMLYMISNKNSHIVDPVNMLSEFDSIIETLNHYCRIENITTNSNPFARMNKPDRYEFLSNEIQNIPYTYSGIVVKQYNDGKIRIRDMVSNAREAVSGDIKNDIEGQKRIIGSIRALERISSSRTGIWKLIYNFRAKAERREAESMRQMLKSAIGENAFDEADISSRGMIDSLQRVKNDLQEYIEIEREEDGYSVNESRADDDLEYNEAQYLYGKSNELFRERASFEDNVLADNGRDNEQSTFITEDSHNERLEMFKF